MTKTERELFFLLCDFEAPQRERINVLLKGGAATAEVLGQLFFNRMQGVAYGVLRDCGCLGSVNREFRTSLGAAFEANEERNRSFLRCVGDLSEILRNHVGRYALLKGALLCGLYPEGYRTGNDVDLLVAPQDLTAVGKTLTEAGFRQGHLQNGIFIPASRREIVESRMMRGETVPYFLEVDLPRMKYCEVDLNFSLDYKNGDPSLTEDLIRRTRTVPSGGREIVTLGKGDFLIHLCHHLYKEATTLPWVKMKRDMTLYKYCDVAFLLNRLSSADTETLLSRIRETGTERVCACVFLWTKELLGIKNRGATDFAAEILKNIPQFLHTVTDPEKKKNYRYGETDLRKRFFCKDRMRLLKEAEEWNL